MGFGMRVRRARVALSGAAVFLLLPSLASLQTAPTRYVNAADLTCQGRAPCYASIQAAIDAAQPGERIVVQAGTYVEQVVIESGGGAPVPGDGLAAGGGGGGALGAGAGGGALVPPRVVQVGDRVAQLRPDGAGVAADELADGGLADAEGTGDAG